MDRPCFILPRFELRENCDHLPRFELQQPVPGFSGWPMETPNRQECDGVDEDAELAGADGECVEVELTDGGVRAKQVVTAEGATGDHHGVAGEHEAGLSHARWVRMKRARVAAGDFNALRAWVGLPSARH